MTLFSGFSVRNTIKQTKVLLEKSVFDLENTRNNVMLSVVSSYLSVLLTMDRLENAKFQLLSTQEQLSRINKWRSNMLFRVSTIALGLAF